MPTISPDLIPPAKNEPKMHAMLKGFVAPPSVGMRLSPEILVLELFREVFFQKPEDSHSSTRELSPEFLSESGHHYFSAGERAVIHCAKGRRKQTKKMARDSIFYAPAYPHIARGAWLSKNRERIIGKLLFEGAFPQWLWWESADSEASKANQHAAVEQVIQALAGSAKVSGGIPIQDILAAASGAQLDSETIRTASETLKDATGRDDHVLKGEADPLSERVSLDFLQLCDAERELPRLLWLRLLMTFLRFALPMWFLARLEITVLLRQMLVEVLEGGPVPSIEEVRGKLRQRGSCLLTPSLTRSRLLYERVSRYIRCRVELNAMIYLLEQLRPEQITGKKLVLNQASKGQIGLSELFSVAAGASGEMKASEAVRGCPSFETSLARISEAYPAWRNPYAHGQGKNINEFLMVLYKAETGDEEGGHLLIREGRSDSAGFRTFPGPLLLQLMAFLAFRAKGADGRIVGGGTGLNLRDIENHFKTYGIDFGSAAETRPLLTRELQNLGLLVGSPDAGSSVAVTVPFLR
jgi:hypothetical protein